MSKTLYLIRHAEAGFPCGPATDFERSLNASGIEEAASVGRRLKEQGIKPDLILCSPAKRAVETLAHLRMDAQNTRHEECIYNAYTEDLLNLVQSIENRHNIVLLIGHNPAISQLARLLTGDPHAAPLPTCGTAIVRLNTTDWTQSGLCPTEPLRIDLPCRASK